MQNMILTIVQVREKMKKIKAFFYSIFLRFALCLLCIAIGFLSLIWPKKVAQFFADADHMKKQREKEENRKT